jgi:hypothetical protein
MMSQGIKILIVAIIASLIFFLIFTPHKQEDKDLITCFEDVGTGVIKIIVLEVSAASAAAELMSAVPECTHAAVAKISSLANVIPFWPANTHKVHIDQSQMTQNISSTMTSIVSNCSDGIQIKPFDFLVPFQVIVGHPSQQASSDAHADELIANQIFQDYGSHIESVTMPEAGSRFHWLKPLEAINIQSQDIPVPASMVGLFKSMNLPLTVHIPSTRVQTQALTQLPIPVIPSTKYTLSFPITISSSVGNATIDGSTTSFPWLLTNSYHQSGPVNLSISHC